MYSPEESDEEEYEILDLTQTNWFSQQISNVREATVPKQVLVGCAGGWSSGWICGKVGRAILGALGGSIIILQIANHQGLITINWRNVNSKLRNARSKMNKNAGKMLPYMLHDMQQFVFDNMVLMTGFAGGFLLGLSR